MKRVVLQIFRFAVTMIIMLVMAAMIFSLREENNNLKSKVASLMKSQDEGVYVLCRFDLKPDADISSYIEKTLAVVPTVRNEDGCEMYALLQDANTTWEAPLRFGERTFWMVEKWSSIDALKAHVNAPHMKTFGPSVRGMRSNSTFHLLEVARPAAR